MKGRADEKAGRVDVRVAGWRNGGSRLDTALLECPRVPGQACPSAAQAEGVRLKRLPTIALSTPDYSLQPTACRDR